MKNLSILKKIAVLIVIGLSLIYYQNTFPNEFIDQSVYRDSTLNVENVYFDFNKYILKSESYPILERLAEVLLENPNAKMEVTGYSDKIGSTKYNLILSKKRAQSVIDYLVSLGCNPDNLIAVGLGESNPVSPNKTKEGRSLNRRVEFKWLTIIKVQNVSEANGVLVPINRTEVTGTFSITDEKGKPYTELTTADVSAILKWTSNDDADSVEGSVNVKPFSTDLKLAITLTMDYSPSMYNNKFGYDAPKTPRILEMEKAVKSFIDLIGENDYAKIIKFGKVVQIIQPFTNDKQQLLSSVDTLCYPRRGTSLFKSIYLALIDTAFKYDPSYVRIVIAFTDGEENTSKPITRDSVISRASLQGIRVNTIGLIDLANHSEPPGLNSTAENDLFVIADSTGGFYYCAPHESQLTNIYQSIIEQLLNSYSISIVWPEDGLPPSGTPVKAIITIKYKNVVRGFVRDYIMQ